MKRPNKYGARKVTIDGITFDSVAESRKYCELKLREKAGEITGLQLQPEFKVVINGRKCFVYRADFAYFEGNSRIILDVKGMKTATYRIKKKIVEALFGICITEAAA